MLKSVAAIAGLLAVTATQLLASQPAKAENTVVTTPEQAVTAVQPEGHLQDEFQADMERALETGTEELAIGAQVQALRDARRSGAITQEELTDAMASLDALEQYYDVAQASSAALPPEHREALQSDWDAADSLQGRALAVAQRQAAIHAELAADRKAEEPKLSSEEKERLWAAAEALYVWWESLSALADMARQAGVQVDTPDRRQGDARSQPGRDHLLEGYAAGRRDGVRRGPAGVPVKPDY